MRAPAITSYPNVFAILTLLLSLFLSPALFAHGAIPFGQDVFVVDDDDHWVYAANFGVMTPELTDRYVCEEAFLGGFRYYLAPFGLNTWTTYSSTQVSRTDDGCHFEEIMALPAGPTDFAVQPEEGRTGFIIETTGAPEVWTSSDQGRSFSQLDLEFENFRPTSLGYLSPDELILIGHDTRIEIRGSARILVVNTDTLATTELPANSELQFPSLLDARAGHFLWHGRRDGHTEIYWSTPDNLELGYFETLRWPNAGALSPDGQRAYLGGADDDNRGVFLAHLNAPSTWEELLPGHRGLCLAATDNGVFVCGIRTTDGHDLAFVDLDNQRVDLIDFRDIEGIRPDCPDDSPVAQICPVVWPETRDAIATADYSENPREDPDDDDDNPDDDNSNNPDLPADNPANEERSCHQGNSSLAFLLLLSLRPILSTRRRSLHRDRQD